MGKRDIKPIHPGRILKEEFLAPLDMSPGKLALAVGAPAQRFYDIVAGKRGITLDSALRLARYFGTSRQFWLGLQEEYEFQLADDDGLVERISREIRPYSERVNRV